MDVTVREITRADTEPFILGIHYAQRFPSISYAYGLFEGDTLEGVVTFGTPLSSTLRSGACGPDMADKIIELNRLCLRRNLKNDASFLVGAGLRKLNAQRPEGTIVMSYADKAQDHLGTVYQATNFLYCGLSAKRSDWAVKGKEHLHSQTIGDEFKGQPNRAALMRAKYGTDFYLKPRSRKHRYVRFLGSKGFRAAARRALRYPVADYPKQDVVCQA